MLGDIRPGCGGSAPRNIHVLPSGVDALFIAADGIHGDELWISDGTVTGTRLLEDVLPGPASGVAAGFATVSGHVAFAGRDRRTGEELWMLPINRLDRPQR